MQLNNEITLNTFFVPSDSRKVESFGELVRHNIHKKNTHNPVSKSTIPEVPIH